MNDTPQTPMPKYKCHKEVWALKIEGIELHDEDRSATITPADDGYAPFRTKAEWSTRFRGFAADRVNDELGYFVMYDDGYASWSPSKAFEEGYSRVEDVAGYPV